MSVESEVRAALLDKYDHLLALRHAHDVGEPVPVARIRELSRRHPGALRELDRAPLEVLEARRAQLASGRLPDWATPTFLFHRWLAVALAVRRAAGSDRSLPRARPHFEAEAIPLGYQPSDLETLMNPPSGRLSAWVLERLARELGLAPAALGEAVFGHLRGGW